MGERRCRFCEGPLPTNNPQRSYCSHYCRNEYWRENNLGRAATGVRAWTARNRLRSRELARVSQLRHVDAKRARDLRWAAENPDKKAAQAARRRALEAAAPRSWTDAEWRALAIQYERRCGYCDKEAELVPDHRTALSRGGPNIIENIIPACADCNARKGAKDELEFRALLAYEAFVEGRRKRRSISEAPAVWECTKAVA